MPERRRKELRRIQSWCEAGSALGVIAFIIALAICRIVGGGSHFLFIFGAVFVAPAIVGCFLNWLPATLELRRLNRK